MSWQKYFPFPEWRPAQAEALDFVLEQFPHANDIFVEAPTGIGKSAIAIALARWLADGGGSTYIATATVSLETQYVRDFYRLGLRQLHSKSWYQCEQCQTCDLGSSLIKTSNGQRARCTAEPCAYRVAKTEFLAADLSISNNAFLLTNARFVDSWEPRPLAIFDEAHLLHEVISGAYSISILPHQVKHMPAGGDELEWLRECYLEWLRTDIRELEEEFDWLSQKDPYDPDLGKLFKKLEAAQRKQQNIMQLLADDPDDWVFDLQPDRLNILPLWGKQQAQELLPRIGQKRVYLSATLPGTTLQMRYLGIDPAKAVSLNLTSPFPVEHRLIHVLPVIRWNFKDPGPVLSKLCEIILRILELHPFDRGIIHVSSYFQAREIVSRCRNRRLITHETAKDKETQMEEMFATPGAVLVSPSSHEGLDLYGDRSRFQVIAKLPFASLGDKRVKRRMETDRSWYPLHTAQKLIQACGRSIRSETDYATTYILDAGFDRFYQQAYRFFPEYFLESLRTGELDL